MYLLCPRCNSVFEMMAETLGAKGRKVSCAVCANTWHAKAKSLISKIPPPAGIADKKIANHATLSTSATAEHEKMEQVGPPQAATQDSTTDTPISPEPHQSTFTSSAQATKQLEQTKQKATQEGIPSPMDQLQQQPESAAAALRAQTSHYHFAPLQFAERNIERKVNELLRFAISWAIWGSFIIAIVYLVRTYPIEIVTKFPNAVHLYERLNLMRPAFADLMLKSNEYLLKDVKVTSEFRLAKDILLISTSVENRSKQELPAPILRGSFRNSRNEETSYFHFRPTEYEIPAKSSLQYLVNVEHPKLASVTLRLTLLSIFEAKLDSGGNRLIVRTANSQTIEKEVEQ